MNRSRMLQSLLASERELLLDKYSGAVAAYSLRYLSSSFVGNDVILVRRSSDNVEQGFTPDEITDGTLVAFCGAGDGFISGWFNQIGSNNLSQTNSFKQSKIINSGSLIIENGRPTIDFSSGNWLVSESNMISFDDINIFYVASVGEFNERILDTRGTGSPGDVKGWQVKLTPYDISTFDDGAGNFIQTTQITRSGQNVVSVIADKNILSEYTNGAFEQSDNSATDIDFNSNQNLYVGANTNGQNTQLFTGKLQEILIFQVDHSANRQEIESNINNYYNVF